MQRAILIVSLCLFGTTTAAEPASLSGQAGYWDYAVGGDVRDESNPGLTSNADIDLDDGGDEFYELALHTPDAVLLPTVAFRYIDLAVSGEATARTSAGGALPVPGGPTVTSEFTIDADVEDWSLVGYYPLSLGEKLDLSLGGLVRYLDGTIVTRNRDTGDADRQDIGMTFPMVHGGIEYRWSEGVALRVRGGGIANGDDSAIEFRAAVDWQSLDWLTVSGGWWRKDYDFEDGDTRVDVSLAGPFLAMTLGI